MKAREGYHSGHSVGAPLAPSAVTGVLGTKWRGVLPLEFDVPHVKQHVTCSATISVH
jgi:hypothetical protein